MFAIFASKKMKSTIMQLKFEGQTHSVDANTLVNILIHYQNIVSEANRVYGCGSREVRLQVNAIDKGSFVIDISVVQNIVEQIFSANSIAYLSGLTTIIAGIYSAYKSLKGRPAKTKEEKKSITTNINDTIISADIINIYNQPVVREAISKSIETADEDSAVDGFSVVSDDGKDRVTFDRASFKEYIYDDFENEKDIPMERAEDEITTLVIVGLNFERGSRWQFMYNGFKISMIVKDDALMQKIDEGERFGKGDAIKVKLRRIQKYNKEYRAYENKSYKITEFLEHIIPNKPLNMFGEE